MQELNIKGYYNNKLRGQDIDVSNFVMKAITCDKKAKIHFRKKFIFILAAVMILTLGCGFAINYTFLNPNGDVLWNKIFINESIEYHRVANDVFNSLELDEGDIFHILVKDNNPDQIISTCQKPFISNDFNFVSQLIDNKFGLYMKNKYRDFTFSSSEYTTDYGHLPTESHDYLINNLGEQEYIYMIQENVSADLFSAKIKYGTIEKGIEINLLSWIGKDVYYYNEEGNTDEDKRVNIDGNEGLIITKEDSKELEILINEVYLTVKYPLDTISDIEIIEIIQDILE